MRFIPRGESEDSSQNSEDSSLGTYVRNLVTASGYTIAEFGREFGIPLHTNVTKKCDVTREKFERVLNALQIPDNERETHWEEYVGDFPNTMQGVVMAGIRRYGIDDLAKKANVGGQLIYSIVHGEQHKKRKQKSRHYPSCSTWMQVAGALGIHEDEARQIWHEDMRNHLINDEKNNLLGAEIVIAIKQSNISQRSLGDSNGHPRIFEDYTTREEKAFFKDVRRGKLRPWKRTKRMLEAFQVPTSTIEEISCIWLRKAQEEFDVSDEDLDIEIFEANNSANENDIVALLHEAQEIINSLHESPLLDKYKAITKTELFAKFGDTESSPGSASRVNILKYRFEHGLPLWNDNDNKIYDPHLPTLLSVTNDDEVHVLDTDVMPEEESV